MTRKMPALPSWSEPWLACRSFESGGQSQGADALAIGALEDQSGERKVLKTSGREIGLESSWAFVMGKALQIRRGIALTGSQKEVDEFDRKVCGIRMDLEDAGIL